MNIYIIYIFINKYKYIYFIAKTSFFSKFNSWLLFSYYLRIFLSTLCMQNNAAFGAAELSDARKRSVDEIKDL